MRFAGRGSFEATANDLRGVGKHEVAVAVLEKLARGLESDELAKTADSEESPRTVSTVATVISPLGLGRGFRPQRRSHVRRRCDVRTPGAHGAVESITVGTVNTVGGGLSVDDPTSPPS